MIAARLRERVELLRPVKALNPYGGEEVSGWEPLGVFNAERCKMTGRYSMEAGERFPDYSAEFNVRDYVEAGEQWRLRDTAPGGNLYTITNIIPNRARGFKTLVCVRVNQ